MENPDASRALAVFVALAGAAHLARRRFYDSLVPHALEPLRREFEVVTGTLQLAGAITLFIPRLRQTARWLNVPVQIVTLLAAVDNVRHPDRIHRYRVRVPAVESVVAGSQIPTRVLLVGSIWWVTRRAQQH